MLIVLDTNVIQASNPTLTTAGVDALLDYAERTESEIVVPQIVLQELEWNYRRGLSEKVAGIRSAIKSLQRLARSTVPGNFEFDIEEEVGLYMATVRGRLKASRGDPFRYKLEHVQDAIARAVSRRRPCSIRGEEIRDAIIWAGILDVLREGSDVAFISANTREFGHDGKLHSELQAEVAPLRGLLHYLNSLEDFAKEHASPIRFITNEWIEQQLAHEDVLHGASDKIVEVAQRIILGNSDIAHAWDFEISSGHLEVDHVSVYVMRNGEYRVFVKWAGSVEVSYVVGDPSYDYGFDYTVGAHRYAPVSHLADYERQFRRLEVWADVETSATVRDSGVASWQIEQVFVTQRYI